MTTSATPRRKVIWGLSFWGNHRLTGGIISPQAHAWKNGVLWRSLKTVATAANDRERFTVASIEGKR